MKEGYYLVKIKGQEAKKTQFAPDGFVPMYFNGIVFTDSNENVFLEDELEFKSEWQKKESPQRGKYVLGWIKDEACEENQMFEIIKRSLDQELSHWYTDESLIVEDENVLGWCELPIPPQNDNFYNL